ncbi:ABC transporter substrate-binding protein [Streptomyces pactum]|uniref:ABC transporter substrate-binding protein n=1 Tax=Streptomyces pactum TaxID=68249 RepID=A0ABS0NMN3_9ACTN|nr:ABC transporter substrate-binding protein [Streptomyces pactum]MBH5336438.1 ABC transporter substrate-binding protein [Streptomyces pactum]
MTGRRRLLPSSRRATAAALCTVVSASLATGCGALPGTSRGSGDGPIVVMTWAPEGSSATDMSDMPAMAQAYARWVNDTGGIHGRELKVITCNERNDSVQAGRCAERAVAEGAVAVVGSYSQHARSFMAPLKVSGIPYIGGYGLSQEEFTSPVSYPVNGGLATLLAGNGRQLAAVCDRVSLVRPDTIAGDELPDLLDAGLAAGRRPPATDIRAPEDASDYTRHARRALDGVGAGGDSGGDTAAEQDRGTTRTSTGPTGATTTATTATADGPGATGTTDTDAPDIADAPRGSRSSCVTAALGRRTNTFFDSFRRLQKGGATVRIASVLGSVRQSLVDSAGGRNSPLEGAYATGWYPAADDPRWNEMNRVINRYAFQDDRIDPADPGAQTTWIAYTVLRSVLLSLDEDDIDGASVRRQLNRGHAVDTGGLTPPLRWGFNDKLAIDRYPRIVNANVTYQVVRNGRLVAVREGFVDVGDTLADYSRRT